MRKLTIILLIATMLVCITLSNALSANDLTSDSTWICPKCGNNATWNYCNKCGAQNPAAESTDIKEENSFTPWFTYGIGKYLPKPVLASGKGLIYNNIVRYNLDDIFYYNIKNATREDFENYKELLIAAGFIPSAETTATFTGATGNGQSVYVLFIENNGMTVTAEAK